MLDVRPGVHFTLNTTSVIAFAVTSALCAMVWFEVVRTALQLLHT